MTDASLAKIFKALSCEQRLHLFRLINTWNEELKKETGEYPCCVGVDKSFTRACCYLDLSRSTVSHHLKELQNAGLISCTRQGQSFLCTINHEAVAAVQSFLN